MSFLKKISVFLALILTCSLLLVGCDGKIEDAIVVGADISFVEGVQVDYDNMFFDDFTNGIDKESWYIGKQMWGSSDNGGVVPENVNYTDEGVLVFSGNGDYYTSGEVKGMGARTDGRLTGGALISKFITGPGRYEIKMKVLPRLGACSAFWTYCYETATDGNHEIDIELPGGKDNSQQISFTNVLNTNYITVGNFETEDVHVQTAFGSQDPIALNDGEWHTFGFDWYTNPQKVVYYIDGKITWVSTIEECVPYVQARLWLGVWFPANSGFVGDANFEKDVMQVDYVKYIPFLDQPCQSYDPAISSSQVASDDEYPTSPVSVAKTNKIANGSFEYVLDDANAKSGWEFGKRNVNAKESAQIREQVTATVTEQNPNLTEQELKVLINTTYNELLNEIRMDDSVKCYINTSLGAASTCGAKVTGIGTIRQIIDAVYQGFELDLSFSAKGKGTVAIIYQKHGGKEISRVEVAVDCDDWQTFTKQTVAPQGTVQVEIRISAIYNEGEMFADQLVLHVN